MCSRQPIIIPTGLPALYIKKMAVHRPLTQSSNMAIQTTTETSWQKT